MVRDHTSSNIHSEQMPAHTPFIPGFDLLEARMADPSEEEVIAIAVALFSETTPDAPVSAWEGAARHESIYARL